MLDEANYNAFVENLKAKTAAALREAHGNPSALRIAVQSYLEEGYRVGLVASELVDFFCVDASNIVESAGYLDAEADAVVTIFDEVHDQLRRAGRV